MKLKNYLKTNEIKVIDFAKTIEVTRQAVYKWFKGSAFPRHDVMNKIIKTTNGNVTPSDFMTVSYERDTQTSNKGKQGAVPRQQNIKIGQQTSSAQTLEPPSPAILEVMEEGYSREEAEQLLDRT